jgi:hypothetical protein
MKAGVGGNMCPTPGERALDEACELEERGSKEWCVVDEGCSNEEIPCIGVAALRPCK